MTPLLLGLSGLTITSEEQALFRDASPAGYILFARNIETAEQVRALTDALRDLTGRTNLPILIDQEGGRIQRLTPPVWPQHPPAASFGMAWDRAPMTALEAVRLHGLAIGQDLHALGISVDCLPLLDVPAAGAHGIIGDRAFGDDPNMVASLGAALMAGLRESGICAVMKHIPGHGRAAADSHLTMPVVTASRADLASDFLPFERLSNAPMAMTAHVRYDAVDPDNCASLSPTIIHDVIRRDIGFDGLLMCDDLGMHALDGSLEGRMAAALAAGCDVVLHCSGMLDEMQALVAASPQISGAAMDRLSAAMHWADTKPEWVDDAASRRDTLLENALG